MERERSGCGVGARFAGGRRCIVMGWWVLRGLHKRLTYIRPFCFVSLPFQLDIHRQQLTRPNNITPCYPFYLKILHILKNIIIKKK